MMVFGKTAVVSVFVVAMAASWTSGGWQMPQSMDWNKGQHQQWQAMPAKDMNTMYMMKHDGKSMPAMSHDQQAMNWGGQGGGQMNQPPVHMTLMSKQTPESAPASQAVVASASSSATASGGTAASSAASAVAVATVVQDDQGQGSDESGWDSSHKDWNKDDWKDNGDGWKSDGEQSSWSKSDDDSGCDHEDTSSDWKQGEHQDRGDWKHSDGDNYHSGQKHKDSDDNSDCDHQTQKEEDCQHDYSS